MCKKKNDHICVVSVPHGDASAVDVRERQTEIERESVVNGWLATRAGIAYRESFGANVSIGAVSESE